jgi:hypothetical protein
VHEWGMGARVRSFAHVRTRRPLSPCKSKAASQLRAREQRRFDAREVNGACEVGGERSASSPRKHGRRIGSACADARAEGGPERARET